MFYYNRKRTIIKISLFLLSTPKASSETQKVHKNGLGKVADEWNPHH